MRRWVVVLVLGAAGCDASYDECFGVNQELPASVILDGETPVFDWELASAYVVSVAEVDDRGRAIEETWRVQCGGDNDDNDELIEEVVCIETPIAYGDRVDSPFVDGVNRVRAKALLSGTTYRLTLATLLEDDGPEPEPAHPELADLLDWLPDRGDNPNCGSLFTGQVDFVAP
jgi:hypothetical protein